MGNFCCHRTLPRAISLVKSWFAIFPHLYQNLLSLHMAMINTFSYMIRASWLLWGHWHLYSCHAVPRISMSLKILLYNNPHPTPQRKTVYSLWSLFLHWYVFLRNVLPFFPPFFPFPSHLMSNYCFWHHNGNLGPDSWYCATFCLCRCWRSWIWYEKMMLIVY